MCDAIPEAQLILMGDNKLPHVGLHRHVGLYYDSFFSAITFFHRHEKRKFKIIILHIPEFHKLQQRKSFQTLKVQKK